MFKKQSRPTTWLTRDSGPAVVPFNDVARIMYYSYRGSLIAWCDSHQHNRSRTYLKNTNRCTWVCLGSANLGCDCLDWFHCCALCSLSIYNLINNTIKQRILYHATQQAHLFECVDGVTLQLSLIFGQCGLDSNFAIHELIYPTALHSISLQSN